MKLQPLSKADLFAEEKKINPEFNTKAAISVSNWYLKEDNGVANYLINEAVSKRVADIEAECGDEIRKIFNDSVAQRIEILKKALANGIISKSMSDDSIDRTIEAVDIIKAWQSEPNWEEKKHPRDKHGKFVKVGAFTPKYPAPGLGESQLSVNSNQYAEAVKDLKAQLEDLGLSNVRADVHRTDEHGHSFKTSKEGATAQDILGYDSDLFFGGEDYEVAGKEHLQDEHSDTKGVKGNDRVKVDLVDIYAPYVAPPEDEPEPAPDPPTIGAYGTGFSERMRGAQDILAIGDKAAEAGKVNVGESNATRKMRQLGSISDNLDEIGVGKVPYGSKAIAAGKIVGHLGPDAEKYMGPPIRRMGYRYRGTERTPDERMLRARMADVGVPQGTPLPADWRKKLFMLGGENKKFDHELGTQVPNRFIGYWESRLADPGLISLQTNSGAIAPSEGVLFDSQGNVVTQAVGYGDDHYLPFNLATLSKVKGGDYLRTRTLGGPTTEDIYAGTMSGARSMTVVSHSGTFTLEFDPTFRGGRRLNDKARRMVARYGKLVDSLDSGQVKTDDVPGDRRYEIKQQLLEEMGGSTPGIVAARQQKYNQMLRAEKENPTPSARTKEDWMNEFGVLTANRFATREGDTKTWEQLKADASMRAGRRVETDDEAIALLDETSDPGIVERYKKFIDNKESEYYKAHSPLRLDGEGYRDALRALQEQFPYYIKEVNWIPPAGNTGHKTDVGYVKARHLRSENIKEGYWDSTIEGYDNGRGSGKRNADRENYSNRGAYQRLEAEHGKDWKRTRPKDMDSSDFSGGGGSSLAGSSTTNTSQTVSTGGSFGPIYSGFEPSKHLADNKGLTDYDTLEQAIKVRAAIRKEGKIPYNLGNGQQQTFSPFDSKDNSQMRTTDVGALFHYPGSDQEFKSAVLDGKLSIKDVRTAMTLLADKKEGELGALAMLMSAKNIGIKSSVKNPGNAIALAGDLSAGMKGNYDFTREDGLDGMHFLPGLAKREYSATWAIDEDVQRFVNSSEGRFGYDMSLNKHQSTFNKMSSNLGKAIGEALNTTQNWHRQVAQYGGDSKDASKVPSARPVQYGGETYSIFDIEALERDASADALAVAKMTQLKRQYSASTDNDEEPVLNEKMKVISLDQLADEEADANSYNPSKNPKDKQVTGDLRTGSTSASGNVTTMSMAPNPRALEEAKSEINNMVGLKTVKTEFDDLLKESRVNEYRKNKGLSTRSSTKHLIFSGNPGTGKTTVAETLGKAYNAMGLIPTDKFTTLTRADLISPYQGQTAGNVRTKFQEGKGGVIFIDEAYALVNGSDDSYGFEAVDELVTQIENNRDDTVVILAGYGNSMNNFLESNPGLSSRFPRTVHFPDYNTNEMNEIGTKALEDKDYSIDPAAQSRYKTAMRSIVNSEVKGNGRDVRNFNDAVMRAQNRRLSMEDYEGTGSAALYREIRPEDVVAAKKDFFAARTA